MKRVKGEFKADKVVYDKADFTKEMRTDFISRKYGDFNSAADRKRFIEEFYPEEWKLIPHYWVEDSRKNIYDPSGYPQFIKLKLAVIFFYILYNSI
ncbi:MAG: hypothetical protein QXN55_00280 [Candidatus Nitrosotenuis sp.]